MKKCKVCGKEFKPTFSTAQPVCSYQCALELNKANKSKKEKKEWNKRKKVIKDSLKTRSDHLNELQKIFNTWVRLRDKGNNCISCGKPCKKENAGHYRSVGGNPELRFEPKNVHLQCEYCNTYLHGNLINYRINLIRLIGLSEVEWLEGVHNPKKYTIEEIKELKDLYKLKVKQLKNE